MRISVTAGAAAFMLLLGACNGSRHSQAPEISNFTIDETIKSVSQTYIAEDTPEDGDELGMVATLSASICWPEKMGDFNLRPLQDTLLVLAFGNDARRTSIDKAMLKFVADTAQFESPFKYHAVDSIPSTHDAEMAYYIDVTARIVDLNERSLSYEITNTSFLGGFHPNAFTTCFTYDLASARVLDATHFFKPGSEAAIIEIIKGEMNVDDLFPGEPKTLGNVYVLQGEFVFHYNPYDIAPYSTGPIDVRVSPWELNKWLSDLSRSLLCE